MLRNFTHNQHLFRPLLYMPSLLRGFNISVRTLCMSLIHFGSKNPRCVREAPGNGATAAKRDFLLFQIGREDRNRENLYCRSATPIRAPAIYHLIQIVAFQGVVQQWLHRESSFYHW